MRRPCEGDLSRQPYAKRECGLLYSDVFASCHNVVSVSFVGFMTYSVFYRKKVIAYPRRAHTQSNTCLLVMHQQITVWLRVKVPSDEKMLGRMCNVQQVV